MLCVLCVMLCVAYVNEHGGIWVVLQCIPVSVCCGCGVWCGGDIGL